MLDRKQVDWSNTWTKTLCPPFSSKTSSSWWWCIRLAMKRRINATKALESPRLNCQNTQVPSLTLLRLNKKIRLENRGGRLRKRSRVGNRVLRARNQEVARLSIFRQWGIGRRLGWGTVWSAGFHRLRHDNDAQEGWTLEIYRPRLDKFECKSIIHVLLRTDFHC